MPEDIVLLYQYRASSPAESRTILEAMQKQKGCLYAYDNHWHNVAAYFEIGEVTEATLPEGCKIVPRSTMVFIQQHQTPKARREDEITH